MTDLNSMSREQLVAMVQAMKDDQARKVTLKVGESGTVCLYHGARYPVALYASQWERILPFIKSGAIERFIQANEAVLSRKEKEKAA